MISSAFAKRYPMLKTVYADMGYTGIEPIVFHCHHGGRSQATAEFYLQKGFRNVWNLQGGIDAWSIEIDQRVKRY